MLLSMLFESHYRPLRLRGRSPNTSRLYGCTLRAFGRWLGYPATVDDLTDLTISRYLEDRAAIRSPFTAEKERTQLLSLWRFAADRGIVRDRPEVPPSILPERTVEAWSPDQMRSLLRAAAATRGMVGAVPAGAFWPALVLTLYDTAERISAILDTKAADLRPPHLHVRAESRKGRRRDRLYTLSQETLDALAIFPADREMLLPWPFCRVYLWSRFADVVARAGLGTGRRARFHMIRRSVATAYAAAGGDATALLDHASPRTTRSYLDPRYLPGPPPPAAVLPRLTIDPSPPSRSAG